MEGLGMFKKFTQKTSKGTIGWQDGFSLIELSIVLIISSILMAGLLSYYSVSIKQKRIQNTQEIIAVIQASVHEFLSRNGRLPCPARVDLLRDHINFGREEKCAVMFPKPQGIKTIILPDGNSVSTGLVPFRSLGISDLFERYGWKNRISYNVTTDLTEEEILVGKNIYEMGKIRVVNSVMEDILNPPAMYTIISHGVNGSGAFQENGERLVCLEDVREEKNCNDKGIFMIAPYSNAEGVFYYDDIVIHDRNLTYGKESVLEKTLEKLIHCQKKSSFYKPESLSADAEGCVQATLSTGTCTNGYVMSGVDVRGEIICKPKMTPGHCQNGKMLLGYDENGMMLCDSTVMKMLSCSQRGLLFAGEGSLGTDDFGCKIPSP